VALPVASTPPLDRIRLGFLGGVTGNTVNLVSCTPAPTSCFYLALRDGGPHAIDLAVRPRSGRVTDSGSVFGPIRGRDQTNNYSLLYHHVLVFIVFASRLFPVFLVPYSSIVVFLLSYVCLTFWFSIPFHPHESGYGVSFSVTKLCRCLFSFACRIGSHVKETVR
jgi:hypothetical protein